MPQIRPVVQTESQLGTDCLNNEGNQRSLQLLCDIVSLSRTPAGKLKMLQNRVGGHLTLTSSSKRLFTCLSVSNPLNQLIVTAAQGHLGCYGDSGLFLASLATLLVLKGSESDQSSRVLAEVFETFLHLCEAHFSSTECRFKRKLSLSSLQTMKVYVKCILKSKRFAWENQENLDFLTRIVLESFITSVSSTEEVSMGSDDVNILCSEGFEVRESISIKGLLIPAPELSVYRTTPLKLKTLKVGGELRVKVAVVTMSMSGDAEQMLDVEYTVESGVDIEGSLLSRQREFCHRLAECEVGLVVCQKVVHPQLKRLLRDRDVLVVDRLGHQPLSALLSLTGCVPIRSPHLPVSQDNLGWLHGVQHRVLYSKSYLLLTRETSPVITLFLCQLQEERLQELKDVCSTALTCLRHLLQLPWLLIGRGVWQNKLASYLRSKVTNARATLTKDLELSESCLLSAVQTFTSCLEKSSNNGGNSSASVAMETSLDHLECSSKGDGVSVDSDVQCEVGFNGSPFQELDPDGRHGGSDTLSERELADSELVLDSYSASLNALRTAVLTASTILRIGQTIT